MHHSVNPVSIRLGKVFNWKAEWSLYNKYLYFQFVRLNFFLFNYLNIWTNLKAFLVRYSLILNNYKIFILEKQLVTIALSYFDIENFVLPNLPLELTEFHRHLIKKEWGTISNRPRVFYREIFKKTKLWIYNNNRLMTSYKLNAYAQLYLRGIYTVPTNVYVTHGDSKLLINKQLLFPIIGCLKPLVRKLMDQSMQSYSEWFFFKLRAITQNWALFKLLSILNFKFCYFNMHSWICNNNLKLLDIGWKTLYQSLGHKTSSQQFISLKQSKLTFRSTFQFFIHYFVTKRLAFFYQNMFYLNMNLTWYKNKFLLQPHILPNLNFVVKSWVKQKIVHAIFNNIQTYITPDSFKARYFSRFKIDIFFSTSQIDCSQIFSKSYFELLVSKKHSWLLGMNTNTSEVQFVNVVRKFISKYAISQKANAFIGLKERYTNIMFFYKKFIQLTFEAIPSGLANHWESTYNFLACQPFLTVRMHMHNLSNYWQKKQSIPHPYSLQFIWTLLKLGLPKKIKIYKNFFWSFHLFPNTFIQGSNNFTLASLSANSLGSRFTNYHYLTINSLKNKRNQFMLPDKTHTFFHNRNLLSTSFNNISRNTTIQFFTKYFGLKKKKTLVQANILDSLNLVSFKMYLTHCHSRSMLLGFQHNIYFQLKKNYWISLINMKKSLVHVNFTNNNLLPLLINLIPTLPTHVSYTDRLINLISNLQTRYVHLPRTKILSKTKFLNYNRVNTFLLKASAIPRSVDVNTTFKNLNLGQTKVATKTEFFENLKKLVLKVNVKKQKLSNFKYRNFYNAFTTKFLSLRYYYYNYNFFFFLFEKYKPTRAWTRVSYFPYYSIRTLNSLVFTEIGVKDSNIYEDYLNLIFKPPTFDWKKRHRYHEIHYYDLRMYITAIQQLNLELSSKFNRLLSTSRTEFSGYALTLKDYNILPLFNNNSELKTTLYNSFVGRFSELYKYTERVKIGTIWGLFFTDCFTFLRLIYLYYFLKHDLELLYFKLTAEKSKFRLIFQSQSWYANQLTASFIGEYVKFRLIQTYNINYIYSSLDKILRGAFGLIGYKISVSGRLRRAQRAKVHTTYWGQLNPNMVETQLSYAYIAIRTKYGVCGIKVWVNHRVTKKEWKEIMNNDSWVRTLTDPL